MNSADAAHIERWEELPELGTQASLRLVAWVALHAGRRLTRWLLYPVTLYFVLSAHQARRSSYEYLTRVLGRRARWWDVFRHFHFFAATILDRIYLLRGEFSEFEITIHGRELLHRHMDAGKGCILLGSHLGSFEVLRALGVARQNLRLKILMDVAHNRNITRFLDALNPTIASTVIGPDGGDALLKAKENLDAGYFVGMLGDRVLSGDKTTSCQFFGAPATFPASPILLAAMARCPIILFFGIYRGGRRYEIFFEQLADEIVLNRERRADEIQGWVQRYAERLEHYTQIAPYNWFNFYEFWRSARM